VIDSSERVGAIGFRRSVVAGVAIGLAGLLGAALLFGVFWVLATVFRTNAGPADAMGRQNAEVVAAVGLGAFVTGGVGWWLLAAKRPSPMRGLLVGTAAGLLAHPACWFVILMLDGSGWKDLLILPPMMGAITAIMVGWVTVPLPALAGGALGFWFARRDRSLGMSQTDSMPCPSLSARACSPES
jgi:hypothetical protein